LLSWENEAFLSLKDYPKEYEIVMPSVSVLAEPSVAIVDKIVDKRNTRKLATEYLNYLYSDEAQRVAAKHHYRPTNKAILDEYKEFDQNVNLIAIEHFGGWDKAQAKHFADGAIFDQIYEKK
jgi:sulfate transport system substrate-binding protein